MHGLDDELYEAFLSEQVLGGDARRNYRYAIDMYSAFFEGRGMYFEEVTPGEVEAFARLLWHEHRNSVAQHVFGIVRRLHEWAADNGIAPDVARSVKPRKKPTPYSRIGIGVEQAESILAAAGAGRDGAIVNLMVRSALKTGDLVGPGDRDVILSPDGGEVRTKDGTRVPLTAKCSKVLSGYMNGMGAAAEHPGEPLFRSLSTRSWGQPLSHRSIREVVNGVCLRASIPKDAGEYNIGSAALDLAVAEGEPLEVILSISDRTWQYRTAVSKRRSGGPLWL